jgi:hypothetical protein
MFVFHKTGPSQYFPNRVIQRTLESLSIGAFLCQAWRGSQRNSTREFGTTAVALSLQPNI